MTTATSGICIDCGASDPDGPDFSDGHVCWRCYDERIYIGPFT
jgi:hypothetical protein